MDKDWYIASVPFDALLELFAGYYQKEYGEKGAREIVAKVNSSKKVRAFLSETACRQIRPGTLNYLKVIYSSSSFTFSTAETISYATVMLLHKWNIEVGKVYKLPDDFYLSTVFFSVLDKCDGFKSQTATLNFFHTFYDYLNSLASPSV